MHVYSHTTHGEDVSFCCEVSDGARTYLLAGVADGHGGPGAAQLCAREMLATTVNVCLHGSAAALRGVFASLHARCLQLDCSSGCTLTAVLVDRDTGAYACDKLEGGLRWLLAVAHFLTNFFLKISSWVTHSLPPRR